MILLPLSPSLAVAGYFYFFLTNIEVIKQGSRDIIQVVAQGVVSVCFVAFFKKK